MRATEIWLSLWVPGGTAAQRVISRATEIWLSSWVPGGTAAQRVSRRGRSVPRRASVSI